MREGGVCEIFGVFILQQAIGLRNDGLLCVLSYEKKAKFCKMVV
jgi:hypothetical protein